MCAGADDPHFCNPRCFTERHCEVSGGHPTLFWEVATGLGGVVGKKGAGDGCLYIKIYSHLFT